jgi:hypothetical protein
MKSAPVRRKLGKALERVIAAHCPFLQGILTEMAKPPNYYGFWRDILKLFLR